MKLGTAEVSRVSALSELDGGEPFPSRYMTKSELSEKHRLESRLYNSFFENPTRGTIMTMHKAVHAHHSPWRQQVNEMLNEPTSSKWSFVLTSFLTILIVGSVAILIMSTVEGYRGEDLMPGESNAAIDALDTLEVIITVCFTMELVLRLLVRQTRRTKNRRRWWCVGAGGACSAVS